MQKKIGFSPAFSVQFFLLMASLCFSACSPGVTAEEELQNLALPVAVHGGWSDIQAQGAKTPVSQAVGLQSQPARVVLSWNEMTITTAGQSTPAKSYNVYRGNAAMSENFETPIAENISADTRSFTDVAVISSHTYYYIVRPVFENQGTKFTLNADSEVKVIVPPENMVLVHRWMANLEMCTQMGRSVDRKNNYRCHYTGPTSVAGFYDIGRSLLFDAVETGCNYTPAPACGDAANGCLGLAAPTNTTGVDGDVFINRSTSICYYKTAGIWKASSDSTLTKAERAAMTSNKPGLPPLSFTSQTQAWQNCTSHTENGFLGTKRLPKRSEQLVAMAWPAQLSNSAIDALTSGLDLPNTGNCNLASANGVQLDDQLVPADADTLPCSWSSTCQLLRTGSNATKNCKTRYGAQDMIGNTYEWTSDQLDSCNAATHSCLGAVSTLDPQNTDVSGIAFNGVAFPGGGSSAVTSWALASQNFSATRFLAPLGLPMVSDLGQSYDSQAIGSGAQDFDPENFRNNTFSLYTDAANGTPPAARGLYAGGSFYLGAGMGRYTASFRYAPAISGMNVGHRCMMAAE